MRVSIGIALIDWLKLELDILKKVLWWFSCIYDIINTAVVFMKLYSRLQLQSSFSPLRQICCDSDLNLPSFLSVLLDFPHFFPWIWRLSLQWLFAPLLHLSACHPSCQSCTSPSQADCIACPSMVSLQNGYCRTNCQEGHFLHTATGQCLSKSPCKCVRAHVCGQMDGVICHLCRGFIKATRAGIFSVRGPRGSRTTNCGWVSALLCPLT